ECYADFVVSFRFAVPGPGSGSGSGSGSSRSQAAAAAEAALEDVVRRLAAAGLTAEVRAGLRARRGQAGFEAEAGHVLVFVSCPRARVEHEWGRSRLHDWLGGMVALRRAGAGAADRLEVDPDAQDDPGRLLGAVPVPVPVAERQRLVHRLITGPSGEGCADALRTGGVAVLALHDRAFNARWLRRWAAQWLIGRGDLARLRAHFGEEVAMYFAFLQSYVLWLAFPAAAGAAWWALGRSSFSWQLGALLVLWAVVFTETWARRESDIATYWGVHGVQRARSSRRAAFRPDRLAADPATGEPVPHFSPARRWARRLLGLPVVAALALLMAALVAAIFALQAFVDEYYAGPLKPALALAPAALFSAALPAYSALCSRAAAALTDYENYEYDADHAAQLTAKLFVFRFLQDQLYLFLTAWVLVPHRDAFDAWLHAAYRALSALPPWLVPLVPPEAALKPSATPATAMVRDLLASFVVTSQLIGMATETGLPLVRRWWGARALKRAAAAAAAATPDVSGGGGGTGTTTTTHTHTHTHHHRERALASVLSLAPDAVDQWIETTTTADASTLPLPPSAVELQFIARVTEETRLPEYTTYEDYAEMASQFGRVAFFSVAWPLAPLAALLNNWLELRTDAAKICSAARRPAPRRVETIGPWLSTLRFMCWLSSITNALLIYQFHPNCAFLPAVADPDAMLRFGRTNLSFALVVLLFSEHLFLATRWLITHVMESWPGAYARISERAQAQMKRRWLERAPAALHAIIDDDGDDDGDGNDGDGDGGDGDGGRGASGWRSELSRGRQAIAAAFKTE
ncbi:hypothetical protein H4R18_005693, partial [Coemansia javaensis]